MLTKDEKYFFSKSFVLTRLLFYFTFAVMIDIILLVVSSVVMIIGIIGCLLPVLPGPPISYVGMLILHFTKYGEFSTKALILYGGLAALVTALDYIIPVWGTKKFGGSKRGQWGATIGLIIGLFFGPLGIIIGPFAGAYLGEITGGRQSNEALKSAFGSFIGFLMGTGIKLVASGVMTYVFIAEIWEYFTA